METWARYTMKPLMMMHACGRNLSLSMSMGLDEAWSDQAIDGPSLWKQGRATPARREGPRR
eukprot:8405564-Lingulodinium_polyedra.AAC.1